jgi:hypothetical protein
MPVLLEVAIWAAPRAQKTYSTDPEYLERMALHEEARDERVPSERIERAPAPTVTGRSLPEADDEGASSVRPRYFRPSRQPPSR